MKIHLNTVRADIIRPLLALAIILTLGCEEKSGGKTADSPKPAEEKSAEQLQKEAEAEAAAVAAEAEATRKMAFEEAVVQIVKLFQKEDTEALNKLLLPNFGIAFLSTPGIYPFFNVSEKISSSEARGIGDLTSYKIHYEEEPSFDCNKMEQENEWKFNKPQGIYSDTTRTGLLSGIAKLMNECCEGNRTAAEIKKLEGIDGNSRSVFVVDKDGSVLDFFLTLREGKWYLSVFRTDYDPCGA